MKKAKKVFEEEVRHDERERCARIVESHEPDHQIYMMLGSRAFLIERIKLASRIREGR